MTDVLDTSARGGGTPRGRHAPPLEVRLGVQRRRLLRAAAAVFARLGYADAGVGDISREARMSKATFYEHFSNKEECILALFDAAAGEVFGVLEASSTEAQADYPAHVRQRVRAFLNTLAHHPEAAQTLLVEIIGAGPAAARRRDAVIDLLADLSFEDNERVAPSYGAPTYASRGDAVAVIGAIAELASRQIRTGVPPDIRRLEDICVRLMLGMISQPATDRDE
jgi:AcrR family transcriptional regulator